MKTLGIVVPFYRNLEYFYELIDSIQRQTSSSYEVLIVDDSGKGVIQRIVDEEIKDDRFSFIENDVNQGPFSSWNIGLDEMLDRQKYSLLSIVHADDVLDRDYVKNSLSYLSMYPEVDIFHSKVKLIGAKGKRVFSIQDRYKRVGSGFRGNKPIHTSSDDGLARILGNNHIFCPTMVFNANMFNKIKFNDQWKMVSDLEFVATALLEGRSFLQMPDKNYYYRRHGNNLTAELTRSTKRFEEEVQLYRNLEDLCRRSGFLKSAEVASKARIIKLHVLYRVSIALSRFDLASARRLIRVLRSVGK